jgi:hypothetical protein
MPALHELGPVPRFFFARIFPWFVVAIGALSLYLGLQTMVGGWASESWPTTPGVVATSEIEVEHTGSGSSSGSGKSYHARVHYEYGVGGESFSAKRVSFGEFGTGDGDHASEVLARYPAGAKVAVHYDPEDPGDAVLEPGLQGIPWFYLLLGTPFTLFGLALARFTPRLAAQGQDA